MADGGETGHVNKTTRAQVGRGRGGWAGPVCCTALKPQNPVGIRSSSRVMHTHTDTGNGDRMIDGTNLLYFDLFFTAEISGVARWVLFGWYIKGFFCEIKPNIPAFSILKAGYVACYLSSTCYSRVLRELDIIDLCCCCWNIFHWVSVRTLPAQFIFTTVRYGGLCAANSTFFFV